MNAYTYQPSDLGLSDWPSGTLRLEGTTPVTDPEEADVFVIPGNLSLFKDDLGKVDRLPYMAGRENRHVVFDVSDNFTKALCRQWIIIRCDARDWMLKDDPNTIQFAWPVEDYSECVDVPEGGFKYDVSAHMWTSTQTRIDSAQSCLNNPSLKCDIALYSDFTGYIYHEPEGIRRRAEFRRSMKESRVALCPESIPGVFPYRFFEAMSAGRVPVLVGSDFVFPFEREVNYLDFIVHVERKDAIHAGAVVREFLMEYSDEELVQRGIKARHYWEKYLNRDRWPVLMTYAVEKALSKTEAAVVPMDQSGARA